MEREKLIEELARAICRTDAESLAWGEGREARIAAYVDSEWMAWLDHANAILARLDDKGLCVVPKEPTQEMCDAAWLSGSHEDCDDHYRAMIAAALR